MGAINFCIATGVLASLLWVPLIAAEIPGLTILEVGWITAAVFACGVQGMLLVGTPSDRSGRRFSLLAACLALASVGYLLAAVAQDSVKRFVALA